MASSPGLLLFAGRHLLVRPQAASQDTEEANQEVADDRLIGDAARHHEQADDGREQQERSPLAAT
jgi:hypothetical protein